MITVKILEEKESTKPEFPTMMISDDGQIIYVVSETSECYEGMSITPDAGYSRGWKKKVFRPFYGTVVIQST